MSSGNNITGIIGIDADFYPHQRGVTTEPNEPFFGAVYVYFDTATNADDFQTKMSELKKDLQFFEVFGPHHRECIFLDTKSNCMMLTVSVSDKKQAIDILKFLKNNYSDSLPEVINISGYKPGRSMVVKPITYFGQIKLTKIDKLELSLKDLVAYLQAESSRELAKAKEKIKSLMSVSIEIEPLVNLSDKKILLQITCLNESLARDLRMALFRLANKANTDSCIRFRNVKDVAGGYHTNMFVLAAKSSLDLENTLKLWDQSTASSSCSLEP